MAQLGCMNTALSCSQIFMSCACSGNIEMEGPQALLGRICFATQDFHECCSYAVANYNYTLPGEG